MFSGECSGCGAGLRDRDTKCRQCKRDNPRFSKSGGVQSFSGSSPFEAVEAVPAPTPVSLAAETSFAAAALAPPTVAERRKTEKAGKTGKAANSARPPSPRRPK